MAKISFNIPQLLNEAFPSTLRTGFGVIVGEDQTNVPKYPGTIQVHEREVQEMNHLGLPIFDPVIFEKGKYNFLEDGKVVARDVPEIQLPLVTTIELSREKKIQETRPNGSVGSVKEMWAFSDWKVRIRGLILQGDPFAFPEDHIRNLRKLEEIADAVRVSSFLFYLFKIKRLVIKSVSVASVQGAPNSLPFFIDAVSDEALEIIINQNNN